MRRRSGTRANPATCACFFDAAQPPFSVPHTLFCSITSFVASSRAPPLQFCQPCTRPHPAECALGLPCPCRQRRAHSSKTLFHKTRRASPHPDLLWVGQSASPRAAQAPGGELANPASKASRHGLTVSAHACRGLRRSSHGGHARSASRTGAAQVPQVMADTRYPSAPAHAWHCAAGPMRTDTTTALAHAITPLRSSHLAGDHPFALWKTQPSPRSSPPEFTPGVHPLLRPRVPTGSGLWISSQGSANQGTQAASHSTHSAPSTLSV